MAAGYSGTPLTRKLGLKEGMKVSILDPPWHYWSLLADRPGDLSVVDATAPEIDFVHLFVREQAGLRERLQLLRKQIAQDGMIWVSWPKKASNIKTDVDGGVVRSAGLSVGLVDVKVCAVDETWSGLKFVIRRTDRDAR